MLNLIKDSLIRFRQGHLKQHPSPKTPVAENTKKPPVQAIFELCTRKRKFADARCRERLVRALCLCLLPRASRSCAKAGSCAKADFAFIAIIGISLPLKNNLY
ncbi:hypothetical protein SAMN04488027_102253 [Psychroflexus sediminis]|uniref:Uncharacterized protein n=1 Tax=Psychroflexus sediminis TaxID=470826 RepID=A0A1G7USN5_9FLAO|nr:hypothetical protein SAMN04488027_102253 [Psychroflexus sediminis]